MNKMANCKTCGAEIAASAKVCPSCGAKNKPPVYKRVWFWLLVVFVVVPAIGGIVGSDGSDPALDPPGAAAPASDPAAGEPNSVPASAKNAAFAGDCGISASAEMGESIIGFPELTISITNTTEKEISAIQFYVVPYDVYGDAITGWTRQDKLYTDTPIGAGKSTSITYQFIENKVKTVKLYVYSVYFSDGSEWGNKDATKSVILDNGALVEVSGAA